MNETFVGGAAVSIFYGSTLEIRQIEASTKSRRGRDSQREIGHQLKIRFQFSPYSPFFSFTDESVTAIFSPRF